MTLTNAHARSARTAVRKHEPEPLLPRDIIGGAEVRRMCGGITRHTLINWREKRSFPAPVRVLRDTKVELWDARQVRAWLRAQEEDR
jgi:hypothetical protein